MRRQIGRCGFPNLGLWNGDVANFTKALYDVSGDTELFPGDGLLPFSEADLWSQPRFGVEFPVGRAANLVWFPNFGLLHLAEQMEKLAVASAGSQRYPAPLAVTTHGVPSVLDGHGEPEGAPTLLRRERYLTPEPTPGAIDSMPIRTLLARSERRMTKGGTVSRWGLVYGDGVAPRELPVDTWRTDAVPAISAFPPHSLLTPSEAAWWLMMKMIRFGTKAFDKCGSRMYRCALGDSLRREHGVEAVTVQAGMSLNFVAVTFWAKEKDLDDVSSMSWRWAVARFDE
jgi:hypothetical protein